MRRRVAVVLVGLLAVAVPACGGDGDDASTAGTTGATGPDGSALAPVDDRELPTILQEQADIAGAAITYTDAQCYSELLVLVLGEPEARRAVIEGPDAVDEALGDLRPALDGEGTEEAKAELRERLEPMTPECRDHMSVDFLVGLEDRLGRPIEPGGTSTTATSRASTTTAG